MLLENQGTPDLLNTFVKHRKIALSTVISSSHSSVRVQISSMVHCLIATIRLLHDCFISELFVFVLSECLVDYFFKEPKILTGD